MPSEALNAASLVVAVLVLTGCGSVSDFLTDNRPTPVPPQLLADFEGVGTLRIAGCNLEGPMHVMSNSHGNRYDVWTNDALRPEQLPACGVSSKGNYPIVFEAEVTARAVGGRIEIGATTGPQTEGGRFFLTVMPTAPELQAQLSTGAPLTERNRVTVGVEGDRTLHIHVAIGPTVP